MSGILKGVSLDAKSCYIGLAAGLVGGLATGVGGSWLLLRPRLQAQLDQRLDAEVAKVKADYNAALKREVEAINESAARRSPAEAAREAAEDGYERVTTVGADDGIDDLERLQPDDEVLPGDVHTSSTIRPGASRTDYHQLSRRADGASPGSGMAASTDDQHTEAALEGVHGDEDAAADDDDEPSIRNVFDEDGGQGPNPVPYGLSAAAFADTPEGYQVLSMTYYAEDKVLIDDATDTPIENQAQVVGPLSMAGFGSVSGLKDTRYVRNDKLEIDVEITLNRGSWVHEKLGYGKPKE